MIESSVPVFAEHDAGLHAVAIGPAKAWPLWLGKRLLEESRNLGVLKLDDLLLPLVDPGRQRDKHHLPGLQDEAHDLLAGEIGNLHHAARIAKRQDGKSAESENSITS